MKFEIRKQYYDELLKAVQESDTILPIIESIYSAWYTKCFEDYEIKQKLINNK